MIKDFLINLVKVMVFIFGLGFLILAGAALILTGLEFFFHVKITEVIANLVLLFIVVLYSAIIMTYIDRR